MRTTAKVASAAAVIAVAGLTTFALTRPGTTSAAGPPSRPSPAPAASSQAVSASPTLPPPISCTAAVKLVKSWRGGFQASASIRNTGVGPINEWYVRWMMPMGITVTKAWNGRPMANGPVGMIHAPESNPRLDPGESATAGFLAVMKGATPPRFSDVGCG
ncbi:cellulose binding domain-containing protein [Sphaerisporangium fuscum]|uniref:cellulose binding domain-containing protein n=1 Tax=Sphaerisporangium fuscum TaxID=2835868 RepID=UPI001BDC1FCF|nr:cellulose binding domain-containing protein [Sphaerisporangium fuscum]